MGELTALESAVLDKLLEGEHPALRVLRGQRARLEVVQRESSGVGFFTDLRVPDDAPLIEVRTPIRFGDVIADLAGLEHGAGFVLYVDGGRMTALEGYTFDEAWPANLEGFTLRYTGERRSLSEFEAPR